MANACKYNNVYNREGPPTVLNLLDLQAGACFGALVFDRPLTFSFWPLATFPISTNNNHELVSDLSLCPRCFLVVAGGMYALCALWSRLVVGWWTEETLAAVDV